MDIRILFLGELGARFGREHLLEAGEAITVADLRHRIGEQVAGSADSLMRPDVRLVVDRIVEPESARIHPGQEVAVLPLYSGG
jgi:molybdopterin converting factor small subunit